MAEVERSHMVLHSMCMRAWAEDSLSVADTQSRIMALTASEDHLPDQVGTPVTRASLPTHFGLLWLPTEGKFPRGEGVRTYLAKHLSQSLNGSCDEARLSEL